MNKIGWKKSTTIWKCPKKNSLSSKPWEWHQTYSPLNMYASVHAIQPYDTEGYEHSPNEVTLRVVTLGEDKLLNKPKIDHFKDRYTSKQDQLWPFYVPKNGCSEFL